MEQAGSLTAHKKALARLTMALGFGVALLGLLFSAELVHRFHFRETATHEAVEQARLTRVLFLGVGLALVLLGACIPRTPNTRAFGRGFLRLVLATVTIGLPLLILDRAVRPFVERLTTLFHPDPELGWRHRASASDTFWGTPFRINAYGLRGPDRSPRKTDGVRRVLVLGDSVMFGLSLEKDEQTVPAVLENELRRRTGEEVECLNAAVSGWSTWQQLSFLQAEGERWAPDLVVLGFVLNDVTERFQLLRFGGDGANPQLAYIRREGLPDWVAESGIYLALRERHLRGRLAGRAAAAEEQLSPYHVLLESDSDAVQGAWRLVLPELEALHAWCRDRSIPFLLVVFPFAIQLTNHEVDAPQWILRRFARRRDIPLLDLLPDFVDAARTRNTRELFLDGLHPTARGAELAAAATAGFVIEHGLLP